MMHADPVRSRLALLIAVCGLVAVASLGALSIVFAENKFQATQLVFTAALPLFGTWVGTVLAFYFAKDNLHAATESTIRLRGLSVDQTPVREIMLPRNAVDVVSLDASATPAGSPLSTVWRLMQPPKSRLRVPVLSADGRLVCIVHESTVRKFADAHKLDLGAMDAKLADLVNDPVCGPLVRAAGFVPESATVADARRAMAAVAHCNDVFVTRSGNAEEPIVGWITNTLLAVRE